MDDGRNVEHLTVEYISPGGNKCTVHLIGVFHGTEEACAAVREAIGGRVPKVLFLELCKHRSSILHDPMFEPMPQVPIWMKIAKSIDAVVFETFFCIFQLFLFIIGPADNSSVCEMRTAHELAKNSNWQTILGDREIDISYLRLWRDISWKQMFFILFNYRKMKSGNKGDIANIYDACPPLNKYLVEERNRFMAFRLREIAQTHRYVVAVVGSSHMEGIAKLLQQDSEVEIDVDELLDIRPSKRYIFNRVVYVSIFVGACICIRRSLSK